MDPSYRSSSATRSTTGTRRWSARALRVIYPRFDGRQAVARPTDRSSWFSPSVARGRVERREEGAGHDLNSPGGDAKLLESTGGRADHSRAAYDEPKRAVSDLPGVVIADPQAFPATCGVRAVAALRLMPDTASVRVDYGDKAFEIRSMSRALRGAAVGRLPHDATSRARRSREAHGACVDGARVWFGLPLSPAVSSEPSWSDVTAAVDAAQKATGRLVLRSVALRSSRPWSASRDLNEEAATDRARSGRRRGRRCARTMARSPEPVLTDASVAGHRAQRRAGRRDGESGEGQLGAIPLETAARDRRARSEREAREMPAPAAMSEREAVVMSDRAPRLSCPMDRSLSNDLRSSGLRIASTSPRRLRALVARAHVARRDHLLIRARFRSFGVGAPRPQAHLRLSYDDLDYLAAGGETSARSPGADRFVLAELATEVRYAGRIPTVAEFNEAMGPCGPRVDRAAASEGATSALRADAGVRARQEARGTATAPASVPVTFAGASRSTARSVSADDR